MKKEDFKKAIEKGTPLVWISVKHQLLLPIVGVNKLTFKDENWTDKPINILYLELGDTPEESTLKGGSAYLWEIALAEALFPNLTQEKNKEGKSKKDDSVAPLQSKISNN